jgi:hypothetical protein
MLQVIFESISLFICLLVGLFTFRIQNRFYRILWAQVLLAIFAFAGARLMLLNHMIYNTYIVIEASLLLYAASCFFANKRATALLLLAYFAVLSSFGTELYYLLNAPVKKGVMSWKFTNMTAALQGLVVVCAYLVVLQKIISDPLFSWKTSAWFWTSLGLITYFGCYIPFMGTMRYLYEHNKMQTEQLFNYVVNVLSNLRYLLLALSFWLNFRNQRTMTNSV